MLHSIRTFSVTLLLGLFLITSCKDNPASSAEEPPQVPSAQTMTMEIDQFEDQNNQQKTAGAAHLQSENAFINAATRAVIVKGVVDASLAIPRVLLQAAASAEAEFSEDGEWIWEYSKTAGEHSYEVRLVASEQEEDQVQWDFYATITEQGLTDQLLFSGISNRDGTKGIWTYYSLEGEVSDEAVSTVEWSVNGEDDIYIRLEVLSGQNELFEDYIEYTFDGTIKHAVYFDASEETTAEIQWNVETHEGFLIAPHYNNGEKACWDSRLQDIACKEG